jgi:transposase InsO family protein
VHRLSTNWIEAIPLKTLSADETVKVFFKSIISRHGCPNKVITDNATNFKSDLYKRLCETFKIEHIRSAAYHSQANGKSERFIRFLKNSLGTVINSSMTNWESMLDNVLFVYRVSYSRVLDDSPFFLLLWQRSYVTTGFGHGVEIETKTIC